MFNGLHQMPRSPTDAEMATQTLTEEGTYRFPSFTASDAVTLVGQCSQFGKECDTESILRDYPFANDFVRPRDTPKEKGSSSLSKPSPDTPSLHVQLGT